MMPTADASTVTCRPAAWEARVRERLAQAAPQRMIERVWRRDASLWTDDPAAQELIRQRLGWLSILPVMAAHLSELRAMAQEASAAGFTHAVLLGMGGSSLFADVCRGLFPPAARSLELSVLDSTDPTMIRAVAARAPLDRTLFVVSSKSGSTIEVASLFDYFYAQVRAVRGDAAGEQFVVVTDAGTPLERQAAERRVRRTFVHGPGAGLEIGGRFSALTYFGLVPAALLGADLSTLLQRAAAMEQACGPSSPWLENPAAVLGLALAEAAAEGRNKLTLLSAPALEHFFPWIEQLVAESAGKAGQGLLPLTGEVSGQAYGADRVFLILRCPGAEDPAVDRRAQALAEAGHPVIRLEWRDRYDVAGEAVRWCVATVLLGAALRINPFDEPNVQESKDRTKALLDRYLTAGGWPVESSVDRQGERAGAVRELLAQVGPREYIALLSYLPRTAEMDAAVEAFRQRLAGLTRAATSLGYGPRYLHSIGQLHKGGPPQAAFIFLTSDDPIDVPIPGRGYSFSVLKRAQALGDVQALQERGRRVLRLHLGASPLETLRELAARLAP